jgi:hypothetical protein
MFQDFSDDEQVGDESDDRQALVAPGAFQDVDFEDRFEQLGPWQRPHDRWSWRHWIDFVGFVEAASSALGAEGGVDQLAASAGVGSKHAVDAIDYNFVM